MAPSTTVVSDVTEETPLLPHSAPNSTSPSRAHKRRWTSTTFVICFLCGLFFMSFGDELLDPAQTRVIEAIYCHDYYYSHNEKNAGILVLSPPKNEWDIPEKLCKLPEIQGNVALLKGWQTAFNYSISLITAPFWAWFADKWGRKKVLVLILVSFLGQAGWIQAVLYLGDKIDIRLTWISSLHALFGGSDTVATALLFTAISDVVPEADRINSYFRLMAGEYSSRIIAPPVTALLMKRSPWITMTVGISGRLMALITILIMPETMNYFGDAFSQPSSSSSPLLLSDNPPDDEPGVKPPSMIERIVNSIRFLASDSRILILLPAFTIHYLIGSLHKLLLQYTSARYDLTIAIANLLETLRSTFSLLLFLILIPWITTHLALTPMAKDLLLSKYSSILVIVGFIGMAFSPSMILCAMSAAIVTLGGGMMVFLRSLITSFVEPHHIARLNTIIGVVDTVGIIFGSPFLAWTLEVGLSNGNSIMLGLPWLILAVLVVGVRILLTFVKVGEHESPLGADINSISSSHEDERSESA